MYVTSYINAVIDLKIQPEEWVEVKNMQWVLTRSCVIFVVILSNMKYNLSSFPYLGLHKRHVGQ
jgi:hypothetical protein